MNGLCFYRIPINESHLRSARRWSRKLDLFELKLANDFMKRRGLDWTHAFGTRVPPLAWIQDELRYWMPALVRYRLPAVGMWSLEIRFGRVVMAIATMYYDLLHDSLQ